MPIILVHSLLYFDVCTAPTPILQANSIPTVPLSQQQTELARKLVFLTSQGNK